MRQLNISFYQLKDLIMHYSNANINYTLSFFPSFYYFFSITRGICYIHLVHCLVFVCFILYQFSFSQFYLFIVVNVYYQEHRKRSSHLDPDKAHDHDMLCIRTIKQCGNSVCKPLSIIFNDCQNEGNFPHEWKKANVVPVCKKGNKQSLKNYRPISLFPICSKIFECHF